MNAGTRGHAFLAEWLVGGDLDAALAAFDGALDHPMPPARAGWFSNSAINQFHECPTLYWFQRIARLDRARPEPDPETAAKALRLETERSAQARDACRWIAESGNDGSETLDTWGTEVKLDTPAPYRFRCAIDHVVWSREHDCLAVRDHKFTWRDDGRIAARMLYGDQLKLYATTFNLCNHRYDWGMPRIAMLFTNVIVVRPKGNHELMQAEPIFWSVEQESDFKDRLWRIQQRLDKFETMTSEPSGWPLARQFQQTRSCIGFGTCDYVPACHLGASLDSSLFTRSTRPLEEEGSDGG